MSEVNDIRALTPEEIRRHITGRSGIKIHEIVVPEWGGKVYLKSLTAAEKNAWEETLVDRKGGMTLKDSSAKLVAISLVDENGIKIFNAGDIPTISNNVPASVINTLVSEIKRFNRMTEEEIETAREDFFKTQSDNSPTS